MTDVGTYEEPTWGEVDPGVFSRIVVVSPHFDDAAMGAGHLLGSYDDTTVITVLAGRPPAYPSPPSEWDALGGFEAGDDVVAVRREEDVAAMAVLESAYRWLDFPDHQYLAPADRPTPADVAPVLAAAIAEVDPTAVFFPMGLANPDHDMTHDACLLVVAQQPERTWFCLRGPRLQAPAGTAGVAGGQATALAAVADAGDRAARARRGAQAPGHLVLHVADRALGAGPRLERPHRGPGAGAVLASRPAAPRLGGVGRPHLTPARRGAARPWESGGPAGAPDVSQAMAGCGVSSGTTTSSASAGSGARSRSASMSAKRFGWRRLRRNIQPPPRAIHPR